MKKMNKKGFTLAELLIVVAIIAVLVAIAIPVFTKQLEKSRDATTMANLRSAYAEATTAFLTGEDTGNADYDPDTKKVTVSGINWLCQCGKFDETDLPFSLAGNEPSEKKAIQVEFVFPETGKATGTIK